MADLRSQNHRNLRVRPIGTIGVRPHPAGGHPYPVRDRSCGVDELRPVGPFGSENEAKSQTGGRYSLKVEHNSLKGLSTPSTPLEVRRFDIIPHSIGNAVPFQTKTLHKIWSRRPPSSLLFKCLPRTLDSRHHELREREREFLSHLSDLSAFWQQQRRQNLPTADPLLPRSSQFEEILRYPSTKLSTIGPYQFDQSYFPNEEVSQSS